MKAVYPYARRDESPPSPHGLTVADPYRWLETDSAETREWLRHQTAITESVLDDAPGLAVAARWLDALYLTNQRSAPTSRPTGLFYTRLLRGESTPRLVFTPKDSRRERVLVRPDTEHPTGQLTAWQVCPNGRFLAYQVCHDGGEVAEVRTQDVTADRPVGTLAEALRRPGIAWLSRHGRTIGAFVNRDRPRRGEPAGLYFCPVAGGDRRLVWTPADTSAPSLLTPVVSPDGDWLLISVRTGATTRNELHLARLRTDPAQPPPFTDLVAGADFATTGRFGPDNRIYLSGDGVGALVQVDPHRPGRDDWRGLGTSLPTGTTRSMSVAPGWVGLNRVEQGSPKLYLVPTTGGAPRSVDLPADYGSLGSPMADPRAPRFWFEYTDILRRRVVFRWDADRRDLAYQFEPAAVPMADRLRVERDVYRSQDGTTVPLTIVALRDRFRDRAPCVLSVYGGFGRVNAVTYRPNMLLWLLSGGVYAVAHVRGGGERGPGWHEAGRGRDKYRAVEDTVAAARHLIADRWTTRRLLAVEGTSNGGLIAAAAAISRPGLFRACLTNSGLSDMAGFARLGLGSAWLSEYGDPSDEDDLKALLRLSPLHNIHNGTDYPAFLISAGSRDTRVHPAHSRKLCAALQSARGPVASSSPVLLREPSNAGHTPGSRPRRIGWWAEEIAFLWRLFGMEPPPIPVPEVE